MSEPNDTTKPVGYWQRSLTTSEQAYDKTQREFLALVWFILILHFYIEGTRFTIQNDHDSLKCILNLADATGRLARLRLRPFEFEFDVVYRAHIECQTTDALFRLQATGVDTKHIEVNLLIAVNDTETTESTKVRLENQQQGLVQVDEGNNSLKKGGAPTTVEFL